MRVTGLGAADLATWHATLAHDSWHARRAKVRLTLSPLWDVGLPRMQLPSADEIEYWKNPDKAGWLQCQGETFKSWRQRWFVLKQGYLYRFFNDRVTESQKPRGVVDLSKIQDIKVLPGRSNTIQLKTTSGGTVCYMASTETEVVEWVSALEAAVAKICKHAANVEGEDAAAAAKSAGGSSAKKATVASAPAAGGSSAGHADWLAKELERNFSSGFNASAASTSGRSHGPSGNSAPTMVNIVGYEPGGGGGGGGQYGGSSAGNGGASSGYQQREPYRVDTSPYASLNKQYSSGYSAIQGALQQAAWHWHGCRRKLCTHAHMRACGRMHAWVGRPRDGCLFTLALHGRGTRHHHHEVHAASMRVLLCRCGGGVGEGGRRGCTGWNHSAHRMPMHACSAGSGGPLKRTLAAASTLCVRAVDDGAAGANIAGASAVSDLDLNYGGPIGGGGGTAQQPQPQLQHQPSYGSSAPASLYGQASGGNGGYYGAAPAASGYGMPAAAAAGPPPLSLMDQVPQQQPAYPYFHQQQQAQPVVQQVRCGVCMLSCVCACVRVQGVCVFWEGFCPVLLLVACGGCSVCVWALATPRGELAGLSCRGHRAAGWGRGRHEWMTGRALELPAGPPPGVFLDAAPAPAPRHACICSLCPVLERAWGVAPCSGPWRAACRPT